VGGKQAITPLEAFQTIPPEEMILLPPKIDSTFLMYGRYLKPLPGL
jgi:hypothetical protein